MTLPGDIRNPRVAERAKEYCWSESARRFPRGITPTDIDASVELNGCFWFFEGKTSGTEMTTGQRLYFRRLLKALPEHKAVLFEAHHPPCERMYPEDGFECVRVIWRSGGEVKARPFHGSTFGSLVDRFVEEASNGALHPERWNP